jgi:hypothetical protein
LLTNFMIIGLLLRVSALSGAAEERRPAVAAPAAPAPARPEAAAT